jgi:hypothetical protein
VEVSEIRNKIRETIEQLPADKLKMILEFLEDLQESDAEATQALRNEPGFLEDYRQAKEDIHTGQTVSWEAIKRDV